MESTHKRMDNIIREVQEIKDSLHFSQKEIDDNKLNLYRHVQKVEDIETEITLLKKDITANDTKVDYLENQSRRNNILIDGVADTKDETWDQCEQKVRDLLKEKLKLDPKQIEIERAHRNGRFQDGGRPRPIVAKLLRFKDKDTIIKRAKYLKGSTIYMNEDFSEKVRQKRKELIPEMKAARERGNIAYLKFDKLIVHPPGEGGADRRRTRADSRH
ncbi:protein unc-13 homolog C-like [Branchiostoma floridae]|uniref:Protein unc-13 homolog C-like n=1 Tax=Branchiostoma floridae TaxID=7739 RepID=A0A9J7HQ72_BRAFL|nr:protein unc-13 homolog C-like [Branchiostoma floridae]XP_035692556.1 protein unc-13 homolog C-like [Branchiostoma floridae]